MIRQIINLLRQVVKSEPYDVTVKRRVTGAMNVRKIRLCGWSKREVKSNREHIFQQQEPKEFIHGNGLMFLILYIIKSYARRLQRYLKHT